MYYSAIVALAIMILSIENHDLLFKRSKNIETHTWKVYRKLLYAVLTYYITDVLWGVLYSYKLTELVFIDTTIYFIAMAIGVLFWTQYAIEYLGEKRKFAIFLEHSGRTFFVVVTLIVVVNIFIPILFWIDEPCEYHAGLIRYIQLATQIVLLSMTSLFTFSVATRRDGATKRRYLTIAWFGLIMAIFLTIQLKFPLLPLYTVAYMLGTCMLRTFVVNGEKEEYKEELERAYEREKRQIEELKSARVIAYKDALTGVKSKSAYVEVEEEKNTEIRKGTATEFAVAVFDLNGLKMINDTYGHERGDEFIKSGCQFICKQFKHSPVFRTGGDEFVAILENADYENRAELQDDFNKIMSTHDGVEKVVVAMGMSDFIPGSDYTFNDVFVRADQKMYIRKNELKKGKGYET